MSISNKFSTDAGVAGKGTTFEKSCPGPTQEWAMDELHWYLKGVGEKYKTVRPHPTFWSLIS